MIMPVAAIAAIIAAKVKKSSKTLKAKKEQRKGETAYRLQDVLGMRLEKEKQLMRLPRRSLRRLQRR